MATIKSYTDLKQSKKLAEILPLESADMHYNNASIRGFNYVDEYRAELMDYNTAQKVLSKYLVNPMFGIIPCWSFVALLNVLPNGIVMNKDSQTGRYHFSSKYIGTYVTADNPVDACYEMILKLKRT